ncbi:hypothetical protein J437_LFUL017048, partial [Ladona fulva]
ESFFGDNIQKNVIKIVIGDYNAKIGREENYQDIVGKHSLNTVSNDNGIRAIEFARSRGMVIHVLIEKRGASRVTNVRSFRGANCESDHYLVCMYFRYRITIKRRSGQQALQKLNLEKHDCPNTRRSHQIALITESTLGHKPQNKKIDWFNQECIEAIQKSKSDRKKYLIRLTRDKKLKCEDFRREASIIVKKKKKAYFNSIMLRAEGNFRKNNSREAYEKINFF